MMRASGQSWEARIMDKEFWGEFLAFLVCVVIATAAVCGVVWAGSFAIVSLFKIGMHGAEFASALFGG